MKRDSLRGALVGALSVVLGAGCGTCRSTETSPAGADATIEAAPLSSSAIDAGELPARCTSVAAELELPGGDTFEAGTAVVVGDRLYLGGLFADGARKGFVLATDTSLGKAERIDLGDLGGGDLAPYVVGGAAFAVVAAYAPGPSLGKSAATKGGAAKDPPSRTLVVSTLDGAKAVPLLKVLQQADESFAFDLSLSAKDAGLVTWDEDSERVVRGLVKVAPFVGGKLGEATIVSPYETDADTPKLVRTADGRVWLAWLARETITYDAGPLPDADKAGAYLEAPGEDRAHQWVEAVALDPTTGKAQGTPIVLAPRKGFVAAFELVASGDGFDAVLVDGAVERDGAGSRLVRVPVRGGKAGTPSTLATGVAGAAAVVGSLVTFVDPSERTMLVPVDGGPATREPLARGGRVVASLPGALVAAQVTSADGGPGRASLRRLVCP